ncbi:MAG TPA: hypothetical protein VIJ35_06420, partial [Bradyrhizobium sp.]
SFTLVPVIAFMDFPGLSNSTFFCIEGSISTPLDTISEISIRLRPVDLVVPAQDVKVAEVPGLNAMCVSQSA